MPHDPSMSTTQAPSAGNSSFAVTRWSVVLAAGQRDSPQWRESMSALFLTYWKPLYAFCRRRGVSPDRAQDLLQAFFVHLIERQTLQHADQSRGRFRAFLLTCFRNFVSDESERDRSAKRGGGRPAARLDFDAAESFVATASAETLTPERAFERRWALTVIEQAMATLRAEQLAAGNAERFQILEPLLAEQGNRGAGADVAARLGLTDNALRVTLHRLRRRYRAILREQVSQTVADPADVEDELRELLTALREP
jgi:RNA polymerase sigma factor (sigma-70 family)